MRRIIALLTVTSVMVFLLGIFACSVSADCSQTDLATQKISRDLRIQMLERPAEAVTDLVQLKAQLWKPKKQPQPFDYPINPKIPKTKSNPKQLSVDPSKHTQFCTYSTLYG